jgi:hypothetical protein
MTRSSRRKAAQVNLSDNEDSELPQEVDDDQEEVTASANAVLPMAVRERNRAVAEREASRLARPERRVVGTLGHASKSKSAVASTPSGVHHVASVATASVAVESSNNNTTVIETDPGIQQEWCGPFSVARQVRSKQSMQSMGDLALFLFPT